MQNKISDLRNHLFATLEALRDKDAPMDVERARAIAEVSQTIINSAKVELQFVDLLGGGTDFVPREETGPKLPQQMFPRLVR